MIRDLPSRWQSSVLVCAKCEKKLDGKGFGNSGGKRLSKLLRKRFGGGWGRKSAGGVVTTRCLGVCPRGAVTVVNGADPGRWLVVAAGTPIDEVEARLAGQEPKPLVLAARVSVPAGPPQP
jgi:predicted metal-binding protein